MSTGPKTCSGIFQFEGQVCACFHMLLACLSLQALINTWDTLYFVFSVSDRRHNFETRKST